jgi:hypothetical protein
MLQLTYPAQGTSWGVSLWEFQVYTVRHPTATMQPANMMFTVHATTVHSGTRLFAGVGTLPSGALDSAGAPPAPAPAQHGDLA